MLEHFPNPASIITWILFTPIPNDTPLDAIIICAQECMVLCLRVITYINITHIQVRSCENVWYLSVCLYIGLPACLSLAVCLSVNLSVCQFIWKSLCCYPQRFIRRNHTPLLLDWRSRIPACRYHEPCELVHLCRVALRRRLLITGGLPDAIRDLPLERRLQDYLNLEYWHTLYTTGGTTWINKSLKCPKP